MVITVHQPQFIPWLGYFDKIDRADLFVILDNVQYKKNEWQNRNYIKSSQGPVWLTVPVCYKFPQKINSVEINGRVDWRRKHLNSIITNYSRARYFDQYIGYFHEIYEREWNYLVDINIYVIKLLLRLLQIDKKIVASSSVISRDDQNERLIDICGHLGAHTYLAGKDGAKYMNLEKFKERDIEVVFQDFHHPVYNQLFNGFLSNMSVIDLIFNYGEDSINIIRGDRR